ncbi:MAG: hypothetical protein AABZ53_03675 [Planctomycetota bacterium]
MLMIAIAAHCFLNALRVTLALASGDRARMKEVSGMEGRTPVIVLLVLSIVTGEPFSSSRCSFQSDRLNAPWTMSAALRRTFRVLTRATR